jgi:hypothetical protein
MKAESYEIITLYYGEAVTADHADDIAAEIGKRYPDQEVEVIDGGQLHYYYILSVE